MEKQMSTSGVLITYSRVRDGHESTATSEFNKLLDLLTTQSKSKSIESFEAALLLPNGSDLGGFVLIRGDGHALFDLRNSDNFLEIVTALSKSCDKLAIAEVLIGQAISKQVARYSKHIQSLVK